MEQVQLYPQYVLLCVLRRPDARTSLSSIRCGEAHLTNTVFPESLNAVSNVEYIQ